jgi:signal transduction histidine kinase
MGSRRVLSPLLIANQELRVALKESECQRRASESLLRKITIDIQNTQESERTRISREMHDGLGQSLIVLKMDLCFLNKQISAKSSPMMKRFVKIMSSVDEISLSIRRIAADLHPAILGDLGLAAAVQWLARDMGFRTGKIVNLELSLAGPHMDPHISTALYRILQEALANVLRHTRSKQIDISLLRAKHSITLSIRDYSNAKSISYRPKENNLGVLGMRERALGFGGSFSIKNRGGTTVKVVIPQNGLVPRVVEN